MTRSRLVSLATAPKTVDAIAANAVITKKCLKASSLPIRQRHQAWPNNSRGPRSGGRYSRIHKSRALRATDHPQSQFPSTSKPDREYRNRGWLSLAEPGAGPKVLVQNRQH